MLVTGNIFDQFNAITEYWSPKVVADVNDEYVKLAKFKGELMWHDHGQEDEMFFVIKGSFDLHLEDEVITLSEGDFYVVKKGIKHKPVAKEECFVMLIEKKETKHTGNKVSSHTKSIEEQLN
ncbi:cupin domain-containing protein [Haloplasma contractile]|uniref:3-hydroxyanthranilate 34-dioxygenase protein n=1 Tax=Haloplasma contractile SSD-17B TaxID=1033810 RepID=F7Q216_9MOLU|nr:cupin domain-containing protein [Haloplasma contractile]ERJ12176.1 3-hydroxyanthranilate 34-dioxygenase protein [Haloplasma contractile SSD-17B]